MFRFSSRHRNVREKATHTDTQAPQRHGQGRRAARHRENATHTDRQAPERHGQGCRAARTHNTTQHNTHTDRTQNTLTATHNDTQIPECHGQGRRAARHRENATHTDRQAPERHGQGRRAAAHRERMLHTLTATQAERYTHWQTGTGTTRAALPCCENTHRDKLAGWSASFWLASVFSVCSICFAPSLSL